MSSGAEDLITRSDEALLGCCLRWESACDYCMNRFPGVELFEPDSDCAVIWTSMRRLYSAGTRLSVVSVLEDLRSHGEFGFVATTIGRLGNSYQLDEASTKHYADLVADDYARRRLAKLQRELQSKLERSAEIPGLLSEIEKEVLHIVDSRSGGTVRTAAELAQESIDRAKKLLESEGAATGIGTPFPKLDSLTSGLQSGDMVVLAARPSVGKTALALQFLRQACLEQGKSALIFSLEMNAPSLMFRLACGVEGIPASHIREAFLPEKTMDAYKVATARLGDAKIGIDDSVEVNALQMRSRCRSWKKQHGLDLVIIDYLQLMNTAGRESRNLEIGHISRQIKAVARELDVPVLVLSQLNRISELSDDGKPRMSQLRESGNIEQDADVIMLLSPILQGPAGPQTVCLDLAKQRQGPTGDVVLEFDKDKQTFTEVSQC